MLNYNTLLSSYDDKLTLMQWLKKVEAALKDASAVSFNVNKRGNATLTFSVVFEDGSELETGPIILQQGESVTNAAITNGHLILTLSNGDTLDAGNTGAVSGFFINAAQHLIVQYQDGTTNDLGAIFNGSITINGDIAATGDILGRIPVLTCDAAEIQAQKPVVEVMTGYDAQIHSDIADFNWVLTPAYVGACKNGNKLTLVASFKLKKTSASLHTDVACIEFALPSDIADKITPIIIGSYGYVDQKAIACFYSPDSYIIAPIRMTKSGRWLNVVVTTTNFSQDVDYLIRYEATFLLSSNLVE